MKNRSACDAFILLFFYAQSTGEFNIGAIHYSIDFEAWLNSTLKEMYKDAAVEATGTELRFEIDVVEELLSVKLEEGTHSHNTHIIAWRTETLACTHTHAHSSSRSLGRTAAEELPRATRSCDFQSSHTPVSSLFQVEILSSQKSGCMAAEGFSPKMRRAHPKKTVDLRIQHEDRIF